MHVGHADFLIIGAARSSTSALARFLESQPNVYITDPKEPHFLAHAGQPGNYQGPGDDFLINQRIVSEPAAYSKLFDGHPESCIKGEGSVTTFAFPDPSIANIDKYCKSDVKLVLCLRDPVERMFSSYLYLRSRQREPILDFREALELEEERTAANWHHMWRYGALSRYDLLLPPFLEHFDDRLHICVSERLDGLASPEFHAVATFLGLTDVRTDVEFGQINSGGIPNGSAISRAAMRIVKNERLLEVAKKAIPRPVQERLYHNVYDRPTLDPNLASELREAFEPSIQVVEEVVGPLPEWRTTTSAV